MWQPQPPAVREASSVWGGEGQRAGCLGCIKLEFIRKGLSQAPRDRTEPGRFSGLHLDPSGLCLNHLPPRCSSRVP